MTQTTDHRKLREVLKCWDAMVREYKAMYQTQFPEVPYNPNIGRYDRLMDRWFKLTSEAGLGILETPANVAFDRGH